MNVSVGWTTEERPLEIGSIDFVSRSLTFHLRFEMEVFDSVGYGLVLCGNTCRPITKDF